MRAFSHRLSLITDLGARSAKARSDPDADITKIGEHGDEGFRSAGRSVVMLSVWRRGRVLCDPEREEGSRARCQLSWSYAEAGTPQTGLNWKLPERARRVRGSTERDDALSCITVDHGRNAGHRRSHCRSHMPASAVGAGISSAHPLSRGRAEAQAYRRLDAPARERCPPAPHNFWG
jgi:hypothetical protein